MDYTIRDLHGFAIITQTQTGVTVVGVPLPMGEDFFAFAAITPPFEERSDAVDYVAALITGGHKPEDFINDDREEAEDGSAAAIEG